MTTPSPSLKLTLAGRVLRKEPTRVVPFRFDDRGNCSHFDSAVLNAPADFTVDIKYVKPALVRDLIQDVVIRRLQDAKSASKAMVPDAIAGTLKVCQLAVQGWTLKVGHLRLLKAALDLAGLDPEQQIEFSAAELKTVVEVSEFGDAVLNCLNDYSLWFPEEAKAAGNLPSGQSTSSAGAPAATA